jgi:hypothetical protein
MAKSRKGPQTLQKLIVQSQQLSDQSSSSLTCRQNPVGKLALSIGCWALSRVSTRYSETLGVIDRAFRCKCSNIRHMFI